VFGDPLFVVRRPSAYIGELRAAEQAHRFHVSCQNVCLSQSTAAATSHTYSPDLAPSDYHRFGQLKESSVDEDLPEMMQLRTRFVLSWQMELKGPVKRCTSGVEKEVIMWRNETLCICDRLLHTNQSVDSLYFLAHPSKSYCSVRDTKTGKHGKINLT